MSEYQAGDQVVVWLPGRAGQQEIWERDTVKRVTESGIITEKNGAFRHRGNKAARQLTRQNGGGPYDPAVWLFRADSPEAITGLATAEARNRRIRREGVVRTAWFATWVKSGSTGDFATLVEKLTAAQEKFGEKP